MSTEGTNNVHKTTRRAIEVLDRIRQENGANISDLTSAFDMSRSSMYTHLNTLSEAGLIVRENGQYWVGLRFKQFSAAALDRKPSFKLVVDELVDLTEETDAEVEFLVEEAGRLNVIYHSENINDDRVRLHLHNTAAGKAILAALPDDRVAEILDRHGLPEHTENTVTDRDALLAELDDIRTRGYAFNDSECFEGYTGIGASIQDIDGSVLGGITIGGPVYRIPEEKLKTELVDVLLEAVDEIERSIEANRELITTELTSDR